MRHTQKIVYTAFFISLGVLVPFVAGHAFGLPGTVLLPMHIPVLLCGFIAGAGWGLACGILSPVLSSVLTGMPMMMPMLPIMIVELSIYGSCAGFLAKLKTPIYLSLPFSMVMGRIGYGIVFSILLMLDRQGRALTVWLAVVTGLPGIIIQLSFIPFILSAILPKKVVKSRPLKPLMCEQVR
jgi:hypothetical protein